MTSEKLKKMVKLWYIKAKKNQKETQLQNIFLAEETYLRKR